MNTQDSNKSPVVPRVENKSVPRFEINRWGEVQYVTLADDLETVVRSELDRDCAYRLHGELSHLLAHGYREPSCVSQTAIHETQTKLSSTGETQGYHEPVEGVVVNAESIGRIYDKWASVYHDSNLPETKSSLVYAMHNHFLHHVKGIATSPPSNSVREAVEGLGERVANEFAGWVSNNPNSPAFLSDRSRKVLAKMIDDQALAALSDKVVVDLSGLRVREFWSEEDDHGTARDYFFKTEVIALLAQSGVEVRGE